MLIYHLLMKIQLISMASAVFRTSCSRISNSEELCDVCKVEAGKLADVKLAVDIIALLPPENSSQCHMMKFFYHNH